MEWRGTFEDIAGLYMVFSTRTILCLRCLLGNKFLSWVWQQGPNISPPKITKSLTFFFFITTFIHFIYFLTLMNKCSCANHLMPIYTFSFGVGWAAFVSVPSTESIVGIINEYHTNTSSSCHFWWIQLCLFFSHEDLHEYTSHSWLVYSNFEPLM